MTRQLARHLAQLAPHHPAGHPDMRRGLRIDVRCGGRRRDERGSASIQLMVLLPVMFLVMFTAMQAALYYHARAVAIAAAQEGAREAGSENGTRESGVNAARDFVGDAGGSDVLTGPQVSGSRSATTATVTVTGQSLSVIPGWKVTITQSSTVPVERLTQPSGEFTNSEGVSGGN